MIVVGTNLSRKIVRRLRHCRTAAEWTFDGPNRLTEQLRYLSDLVGSALTGVVVEWCGVVVEWCGVVVGWCGVAVHELFGVAIEQSRICVVLSFEIGSALTGVALIEVVVERRRTTNHGLVGNAIGQSRVTILSLFGSAIACSE